MTLKKRARKIVALTLVGVTISTPLFNTVSAMESKDETSQEINNSEDINDEEMIIDSKGNNTYVSNINPDDVNLFKTKQVPELRLGGGPSPSAAWTYKKSYSNTFTAKELNNLSIEYQGVINSFGYNIGQKAYNASLMALGYMGKKNSGANVANTLAWFAKTYHSEIQRSANVLASAASKKKSVNLRVKEYVRPASGATMILFY